MLNENKGNEKKKTNKTNKENRKTLGEKDEMLCVRSGFFGFYWILYQIWICFILFLCIVIWKECMLAL